MIHVECGSSKMIILYFRTVDNFFSQSKIIVQKLNFLELMTTQKTPTENGNLKMAVLLLKTEGNFITILLTKQALHYEEIKITQKINVENGNSAKSILKTTV
jgi:hypothetical protein